MFYKRRESKTGKIRFEVGDSYKDPLTGKWKTASVSYYKDTSSARKKAEFELQEKIENLLNVTQSKINVETILTFKDLREAWFESWCVSVKKQTADREKLVLKRLGEIIGDDYLLTSIKPLLLEKILKDYIRIYDCSASTFSHIRSSLNKILNYGVLHQIYQYNPLLAVKINVSKSKKRKAKLRKKMQFLEVHELLVFFEELSKRRNPNYYDLAIFLLFTGIRIGEAGAVVESSVDLEKAILDVSRSLQSHDLKVDDFYYDETKTDESERYVRLPQIAVDAYLRALQRSNEFDKYMFKNPKKSFRKSSSVFRTEYGSPITSHSFREIISRIETDLKKNCMERYGFEWKKHVTPHSFRHMHITYLQRGDAPVPLKEIMERVGHVNPETTMGYTHSTIESQNQSILVMEKFALDNNFNFKDLKIWKCKYSQSVFELIEENIEQKSLECSLSTFRTLIGINESYAPRHITANILPRVKEDISKYIDHFEIITIRKQDTSQKVDGYKFVWG
ncbi:tyrosine-type recombinase/integrase [Streptococcus suis]|uniref:tyrosine-type recombinase/integrase n=1 Tax=Streptococcus TaxID=1301 RepID=UPI0014326C4A|nr:tyrosine-type recombinase/integrase [Streptococcus suis]MBY4977261.1 tyrosine-type recombinase/integrase [Streptococcus suis]NJW38584.1 site-specific integrase [Streptococcus suis]